MSYSLFELNEFIRQVLALNLNEDLWVKCELAQVKYSRGHCYLDLVQKNETGDVVLAQGQAVVWALQLRTLRQKLGFELEPLLQEGMEVLMLVSVEFHERFGLKLMVKDFDPSYTLGKLALKKRETLLRLEKEGLLTENKKHILPRVVQNIAVLSSKTAAGLKDFINELEHNEFGFSFNYHLFPVAMQGANVGHEIAAAISKINPEKFDAIVIIRGGGSKMDLAAYDDFELCKEMALAALPILAGIGHEVDETVLDKVAHTSLKTPTAVAGFILHRNLQFESEIIQHAQSIQSLSIELINEKTKELDHINQNVIYKAKALIERQSMMLSFIEDELPNSLKNSLKSESEKVNVLEKLALFLGPEMTLKRGFSITLKNGKPVNRSQQLNQGDEIETIFQEGKTISVVKKTSHE